MGRMIDGFERGGLSCVMRLVGGFSMGLGLFEYLLLVFILWRHNPS